MEIIDYPNYLIHRDGRVFSKIKNKFLKHRDNGSGYKIVGLHKNCKPKNFYVHRLLGIHYLENPENKPTIDHINRIRDDNRVENLRWATRKEQIQNQKVKNIRNDNKSGHLYICRCKNSDKWLYQRTLLNKKRIRKVLNTKIDALCFKFIDLLKIDR